MTTTTINGYRVQVYATGINFGFAARILLPRARKPVYVTGPYIHRTAAIEAAERWISKQS